MIWDIFTECCGSGLFQRSMGLSFVRTPCKALGLYAFGAGLFFQLYDFIHVKSKAFEMLI